MTRQKIWNTPFTKAFQCRLPICSAAMAGVSGGKLASQVCRAGGLGIIAAGHFQNMEELEHEIDVFWEDVEQWKSQLQSEGGSTNNNNAGLAIGFIGHSSLATNEGWKNYEHFLQRHKPLAVQFFAPSIIAKSCASTVGSDESNNVKLAQKYGTKFIAQVGTIKEAREAIEQNVNAIICQGSEAGGHGLRRNLGNSSMALASQVSKLTDIPVLAAGGIVTGRHVASALCVCDGAAMGTRFWASEESIGNKNYQQKLVQENSCDDVVRTTVFDQIENEMKSCKWPHPYDSVGALRNQTTMRWEEHTEEELKSALKNTTLLTDYKSLLRDENAADTGCVLAGEGVGEIESIECAYDIMIRIEEDLLATITKLKSI